MSESSLKKELLLGSLMAFVITGNAFAADGYIGSYTLGSSHTDAQILSSANFSVGPSDDVLTITKYGGNGYSARFKDMTDVKLKAKTISSFGIFARDDTKLDIGSSDTDSVAINGDTVTGVVALARSQVTINAKNISISTNATADEAAIWVQNNTQSEPAPAGASSVKLVGDKIVITSKGLGIVNFSNGQFNAEGDITIDAPIALDVRGNSTTEINTEGNHTTVINGDIQFETPWTPSEGHGSGNLVNAHVDLNLTGKDSSWTGSSYIIAGDNTIYNGNGGDNYGPVTDFKLNMQDGATWNATGNSYVNEVNADNSIINLKGDDLKIIVDDFSGDNDVIKTDSLNNQLVIGDFGGDGDKPQNLIVSASGAIGDEILKDSSKADKLVNIVVDRQENRLANHIHTDEGIIAGAMDADVENGNIVPGSVTRAQNTTNAGIAGMAALNLITWRQENNDLNKRLGELRSSEGEHGVWARMVRGEAKYNKWNLKNQYNYYQLGYDQKVGKNWTLGIAYSKTDGTTSFTRGSAENDHDGIAIYGTWLGNDGSFVDLIGKYANIDTEYRVNSGVGSADYDNDAFSFSAEYGKRFKFKSVWIEPQVELTYGSVDSADYTTKLGAKVHHDKTESLVGRLGFAIGKDIKAGNVYVRASYLHDFKGEANVDMSYGGAKDSYKDDIGGSWWEVGLGANLSLSKVSHIYVDVEKTYGGDVTTPWQWGLGYRYSF